MKSLAVIYGRRIIVISLSSFLMSGIVWNLSNKYELLYIYTYDDIDYINKPKNLEEVLRGKCFSFLSLPKCSTYHEMPLLIEDGPLKGSWLGGYAVVYDDECQKQFNNNEQSVDFQGRVPLYTAKISGPPHSSCILYKYNFVKSFKKYRRIHTNFGRWLQEWPVLHSLIFALFSIGLVLSWPVKSDN